MSSVSLVDYIAEKLYSYSSKMRVDSFQHNVTSFLMSSNNSSQQYDLSKMLSEVKENSIFNAEIGNPYYPLMSLLRPLGISSGFKYISGTDKSDNFPSYHCENGRFSPHLFNLVLDSYRYRNSHSDSLFIPSGNMFFSPANENLLGESHKMSQHSKTDSDVKKICDPPVIEAEMSVNVNHSLTKKKSEIAEEKCNFSHSLKLNLELAHRKTKEMNKRSKKRRRRQKKLEHLNVSNSTSASDDDDCNLPSPVTSSVCFIAKSSDFGCTLSVKQTLQVSPCKPSFIIPVGSDSDDDSEWETFDEIELSNSSNLTSCSEIDCNVLSSPDSSPVKSESSDSKYPTPIRCSTPVQVASAVMSCIVPEVDSCDDDSDWDSCETDSFTEDTGFEFTGLLLTNLCTSQTLSAKSECNLIESSDEESDEILQLRAVLLEVNKNWNELTKDDDKKPKSISKVTFAPDDNLVEVFPVEIYERKGEWEMYATERLRFKRKIDELEKVLSPCLNTEHRSKIFKKLVEPEL